MSARDDLRCPACGSFHAPDVDPVYRAAPELYEALEAALPVMEARAPDFDVVNAAIRAALAKASGSAP